MMLKRSTTESKPSSAARLVRAGLLSLMAASAACALATGCLDRPVVKAKPTTSNLFVDQIVQTGVDKIDLLFMIDNSASMADKQEILKDAVPRLLTRLIDPVCVDAATGAPTSGTNTSGCAAGSQPEFTPIGDIHIGVVTSSLGAHGGQVCGPTEAGHKDDKGELLGSLRAADGFAIAKTWNNSGFLAWDSSGTADSPAGVKDPTAITQTFQDMVAVAGENGCGFEAQLEGWYRFLIDPEPPANVVLSGKQTVRGSSLTVNADGTTGACTGCDMTLLAQRKAFLRPDSLVAIVMLTDENDCSIRDDLQGWYVGTTTAGSSSVRMPRATAACATNPNSQCCRSCAQTETTPPTGCPALKDDTVCKATPTWDGDRDSVNERCWIQRQRFGFDLLYPTSRYVAGLTQPTLQLQSNPKVSVVNPLFDNTGSNKAPRVPGLVFLAGIVGVPWQDIADDASITGAGLTYLTAKELLAKDRWSLLLGDPTASPPVPPRDPFMIETTGVADPDVGTTPRSGMNPITKDPIVPATSMDPHANKINGHEQNIPAKGQGDLQYACISPLKTPKDCMKGDLACDCAPTLAGDTTAIAALNSPLCQGGTSITQQTSFKAYPGSRELQVLKDFGANAIVASICPKVTDTKNADYGYNPAVGAIIERLKEALQGKCLPRPIQTDPMTHEVLCKVIEAQKSGCDCTTPGRAPADAKIQSAVQDQLKKTGNCGNTGQPACSTWCQCEIVQEANNATNDLANCQSNAPVTTPGYCYIDKSAETVNNGAAKAAVDALLNKCPANEQQLLRFVDADPAHKTPAQGAPTFIACLGAAVVEVGADGGT